MKSHLYALLITAWQYVPLKKQLIGLLRAINVSFDKYIRDLWFVGDFRLDFMDSSFHLFADRSDNGMLELFYKGLEHSWDAHSLTLWGTLARRSRGIFDIGANFGLYAIAAKSANPQSLVYAFEPSTQGLKMLRKNVATNNYDIKVVDIALSNANGLGVLHDSENSSAASSLVVDQTKPEQGDFISREVQTQTFVSFVEQERLGDIDLLSIDVELFEREVLEGMGELIATHSPDVIIEVLNNEAGEQIEPFFRNEGYHFFEIDEQELTAVRRDHLARSVDGRDHSFNFLICTEDTAKYLGLSESM